MQKFGKYVIIGVMGIYMVVIGGCHKDNDDTDDIFRGKIAVGGHQLYIRCKGQGTPAVILEAGCGDSFSGGAWTQVYDYIADFTTVCGYDRAGLGKSDMGPEPRSSQNIAGELHTLLQKLSAYNIAPPYILAGHSMGGIHIWTFANSYPDDIAGLVFVDSSYPAKWMLEMLQLPSEECEELMAVDDEDATDATPGQIAEGMAFPSIVCTEADALKMLPDVPVAVLTHSRLDDDETEENFQQLYAMHQKIADLASDSTHQDVDAGHYIQHDAPELVISSIMDIYNKAVLQ